MSRVQIQNISKKERQRIINEMFEVITSVQSKKETISILMNLLTSSEVLMVARRIQIAKLLLEDKSYQEIHEVMGVGNGTIKDVAQWLFGDDALLKNKVKRITKNNKQKSSGGRKHNLLDPYGQLRALQDLLDM